MKQPTQANTHVIVAGAGYAGLVASLRLAGKARQLGIKVSLVSASDTYRERVRLHELGAGREVASWPLARLTRGRDIQLVEGTIETIEPDSRRLTVRRSQGTQELSYDYLLYALGSSVDIDSVPGVRENAMALGGPTGAEALAERLRGLRERGERVVVCGGGLTGIEAATEIAEAHPGLHVQLVTRGTLGAGLSERGRRHVLRVMQRLGVNVTEAADVCRVSRASVQLHDDSEVPFDLCLWAGSFRVPELAAESGLAVNGRGQVLIDPFMRSVSHPTVFAAGDAAAPVEQPGAPIRMACATAMPMGAHAANCLLDVVRDHAPAPFSFRYVAQCISLGRRDGLVQFVGPDDAARERILTGRAAAAIKEMIVRYTVFSLKLERRRAGSYRWPHAKPLLHSPVPTPALEEAGRS